VTARRVARSRRLVAGALLLTTVLLPLLVLAPQHRAAAADDGSQTKGGTGRFSGLQVTVSKVDHMRNEVVRVSWSGAEPSFTSGRSYYTNYLQIMECWGDEDAPQREKCQYGGIFDDSRGGQATSTREIVNNGQLDDPNETYHAPFPTYPVVPFAPVNGKPPVTDKRNPYFDTLSTNEIDYARTSSDGTGEEFFEVQTGREASGLGCGARKDDGSTRDCWLVVVPRDDIEVNGENVDQLSGRLETSPLAASNFKNAISFRLHFDPLSVTCRIGAEERQLVGNEEASEAVVSWQPKLCDTTGETYGYTQQGDELARSQVVAPEPWLSLVHRPLDPGSNPDDRLVTYAPVTISAVGIGVVIERVPKDSANDEEKAKRGTRVLDLKLDARLVAKLLTQSYKGAVSGDAKYLGSNPESLVRDKEFLSLNPEFDQLQYFNTLYSITNPLDRSDANLAVWQWIKSDPDARAFIGGKADPWGTKINPHYKGMSLDRPEFPRADPSCITFPPATGMTDLCALDHLAYAQDFHAEARAAIRGQTLQNDTWDYGPPARWKQNPPQSAGERAVLALVDTATAARFKVSMAQLKNAAGRYVAPTNAAMGAAVSAMKASGTPGVVVMNPASKSAGAYPMTQITYAATAPRQLSEENAKAYAEFLGYAAGDGQTPGIEPGMLPAGYLPLTAALRKQTRAVADLVAKRGGPLPPAKPAESGDTPVASAGDTSAAVAAPPVGAAAPVVGAPVSPASPATVVPAAVKTPAVRAGATRFALVGAALLGLIALAGRPVVVFAGAIRTGALRRRRGARAP
jgi:hypothetical protein